MKCVVCGEDLKGLEIKNVLNDKLVKEWGLSEKQRQGRDGKESMNCNFCGSSMRSRGLASGVMKAWSVGGAKFFKEWVRLVKNDDIKVAEINYFGDLHRFLADLPLLKLSQFSETSLRAKVFNWLKGIGREDITCLSYANDSFDLVIHSEVLEHVAEVNKALSECVRVLKPNGVCVFSIPVMMDRKTKKRAEYDKKLGKVKYLMPACYHGSGERDNLVYWEFGGDFVKKNNLNVLYKKPENGLYVFGLRKSGMV